MSSLVKNRTILIVREEVIRWTTLIYESVQCKQGSILTMVDDSLESIGNERMKPKGTHVSLMLVFRVSFFLFLSCTSFFFLIKAGMM